MQLFFTEKPESEIVLSKEESKHATKVLRKKEGDILNFADGKGGFYRAEITVADTKNCKLQIISSEQKPTPVVQAHQLLGRCAPIVTFVENNR